MDWMALTYSRNDLGPVCIVHFPSLSFLLFDLPLFTSFLLVWSHALGSWLFLGFLRAMIHFGYIGRAIDRFVYILLFILEFIG